MDVLTIADWVILGFIALSVLIGLVRGLVVEVLSIVIWVVAVVLAIRHGEAVGALFQEAIELPSARVALGYGLVFFGTTIVGALVLWLTRQLVAGTGLSGTDRLLGAGFGMVRGVLLVVVVVTLARMTPLPRDPWWQASRTIPVFIALGDAAVAALPDDLEALIEAAAEATRALAKPEAEPVAEPPRDSAPPPVPASGR
jgi:membrane protein required for colicin V production